jgi:MOSC domain-containing protein YiiM
MMSGQGTVVSLHAAPSGGVPKGSVPFLVVGMDGCEGDLQRNKRHHGGPSRAVCLYAAERMEALRHEGHPIKPGSTGENVLIAGLDWSNLSAGDKLAVGEVVLRLTSEAPPCSTIAASFTDGAFTRISGTVHPGWSRWYAAVENEGKIVAGQSVVLNSSA